MDSTDGGSVIDYEDMCQRPQNSERGQLVDWALELTPFCVGLGLTPSGASAVGKAFVKGPVYVTVAILVLVGHDAVFCQFKGSCLGGDVGKAIFWYLRARTAVARRALVNCILEETEGSQVFGNVMI